MLLAAVLLTGAGLGASAPPLEHNDFTIDFAGGPVVGSARIVAMGGAFTALAEQADGIPWNPAAYNARSAWEVKWLAWDAGANLVPAPLTTVDFYNSGAATHAPTSNAAIIDVGGRLQLGRIGIGLVTDVMSLSLV